MKLKDLAPELRSRVAKCRWDRIIEKHEGPWDWQYDLRDDYIDFLQINGFHVLLPIGAQYHANIEIERCIPSADGKTLTIFLQDTTYDKGMFAGYMAVCEKFPEEEWFIAIVYHECWISRLETNG